jgi:Ca-activated chloride channel homolog
MKHLIPFLAVAAAGLAAEPSAGELWRIGGEAAPCPLEHTAMTADLSGPVGRVRVKQIFRNPLGEPLEAMYTFPLSARGAVDEMTIRINDRVVKGQIKRKEEARRIYEQAKQQGKLTGLLDQKRPNVFTQRLANIPPGARVEVEISYVETLQYEAGRYEFVFPMTVGPRYKAKYNPTYAAKGVRAGHDLSLSVKVNGVTEMESPTHEIVRERGGVALRNQKEIPNRDFILRYKVAGPSIKDTLLAHRGEGEGHFTLFLAPPERVQPAEVTPKELVFVIDTSGSMHGYPLDKAKEAMSAALAGLHPRDTFNLITFSGDTHLLFPAPVPATPENLAAAQKFLRFSQSGGGTEMMKAIRAALAPTASQEHLRVVCFMTDGYVGNEPQILAEMERYPNARVFSFGIGSSVNRYLLDEMAARGRGEVEYVGLQDDGSAAAKRFYERVHTPLLTDIRVEWGNLPVREVYPRRVPDLFDAKPVVLTGQFTGPARGEVKIIGKMAGRPFERKVWVDLPAREAANSAVPALWARTKIGTLRDQAAITELGLAYGLMTQFTSFVAVEEGTVSGPGGRFLEVPAEMPDGVAHEEVVMSSAPMAARIGDRSEPRKRMEPSTPVAMAAPKLDPLLEAQVRQMGPQEKVGVRVYLTDASAATLAALQKAGLVVAAQPGGGLLVIGEIAAGRVAELSRLGMVKRVALR